MTEGQARACIDGLTYEEKVKLNDLLKQIEKESG